jgi:hypothetical protein
LISVLNDGVVLAVVTTILAALVVLLEEALGSSRLREDLVGIFDDLVERVLGPFTLEIRRLGLEEDVPDKSHQVEDEAPPKDTRDDEEAEVVGPSIVLLTRVKVGDVVELDRGLVHADRDEGAKDDADEEEDAEERQVVEGGVEPAHVLGPTRECCS